MAANVNMIVFVRRTVFTERLTWKNNPSITPAHCDDTRTFQFINELQSHPSGPWIDAQFDDVMDMITRLKNLQFDKLIKSSDQPVITLSNTVMDFVKNIYPNIDGKRRLDNSEIEHCINVLRSFNGGFFGILLDDELEENRWWMYRPIRPADDDGSSWFADRQLTAEGHVALNEMLAYQKNIRPQC